MKKHLEKCPSCDTTLEITCYTCPECGINVQGHFSGCTFCKLSDDDRVFALAFLQTEGNMKDIERLMGISYPTVKARLAKLNRSLSGEMREPQVMAVPIDSPTLKSALNDCDKSKILDRLASGEITPRTAIDLLKGKDIDTKETEE
jgi:hypothetical protein